MLEKSALPDEPILSAVQEQYWLHPTQVTFLPLGYDVNTAVYRVHTLDGTSYFLKLRSGEFNQVSAVLPRMLATQGFQSIIAPLVTKDKQLWGGLAEFKLILYLFLEGRDGYQMALSEQQWLDFGTTLKGVHTTQLTPVLKQMLPQETYSPHWRTAVKQFQAQVENIHFAEPVAKKLAAFMQANRNEIRKVVDRTETLSQRLREQLPVVVLCHADIHPGNLLISPHGEIYIVDWDAPILAPKERDLALIGGCPAWSSLEAQAQFF